MATTGTYDRGLLAAAPQVEKAEARKGYDVAILDPTQQDAVGDLQAPNTDGAFAVSQQKQTGFSPHQDFSGPPKSIPLWRTTRGHVAIAILVLVIIGAALGGGLGGGLHHKSATSQPTTGGGSDGSGSSNGSDTYQGTSPQSASGVLGQQQGSASPSATRRA